MFVYGRSNVKKTEIQLKTWLRYFGSWESESLVGYRNCLLSDQRLKNRARDKDIITREILSNVFFSH
jgi:hypothetical protein